MLQVRGQYSLGLWTAVWRWFTHSSGAPMLDFTGREINVYDTWDIIMAWICCNMTVIVLAQAKMLVIRICPAAVGVASWVLGKSGHLSYIVLLLLHHASALFWNAYFSAVLLTLCSLECPGSPRDWLFDSTCLGSSSLCIMMFYTLCFISWVFNPFIKNAC